MKIGMHRIYKDGLFKNRILSRGGPFLSFELISYITADLNLPVYSSLWSTLACEVNFP